MPRLPFRAIVSALGVPLLAFTAALLSSGVTPPDAHAATVVVDVTDDAGLNPRYEPPLITINAGDTVEWQWTGTVAHTVSRFDAPESFDSGVQTAGSFSHTFTTPGSYLYLCGVHAGMTGTVNVMGVAGGAWTPTLEMTTPRTDDASVVLANGDVLTVGGMFDGFAQPSAEIYSGLSNSWTETDPMSSPRAAHVAVTLSSGEVLVHGGRESDQIMLSSALLYDPLLDAWDSTGSTPAPRRYHVATKLADGRILLSGGQTKNPGPSSPVISALADIYDRLSDGFSTADDMVDGRMDHTATLLLDGRVLVAGGANGSETFDTAEFYDPSQNLWSSAPPLGTPRARAAAVRLLDGRVLVTGGRDIFSPGAYGSTEIYDPVADEWSDGPNMTSERSDHTATLLLDGRVLVAGGENEGGTVDTTEIYDPVLNHWQLAPDMNTLRTEHDAVLLETGAVLVIGGTGASVNVAHAEYFGATTDDGDDVPPDEDNCPTVFNPGQENTDSEPHIDDGSLLFDTSVPTQDEPGDACDSDDDNDWMSDDEEATGCVGDLTDPLIADSDGDRVIDGVECDLDSNPTDAGSMPLLPQPADDADADSLFNDYETSIGSDPDLVDSDGDGITDGVEVKGYGTSPADADTDDDGCDDGQEIGSVDESSAVNAIDLLLVAQRLLRSDRPVHDVDKSGQVNSIDLLVVASNFNPAACGPLAT